MDEIVSEFLIESWENLDQLDRDLLELEKRPAATDLLGNIFRIFHTIKGACGFLAFHRLEAITHATEGLLGQVREGRLSLTADVTSTLLAVVDAVRQLLTNIESSGCEGDANNEELIARIQLLQAAAMSAGLANAEVDSSSRDLEQDAGKPLGQLLVENAGVAASAVADALERQQRGDVRRLGEILVEQGSISPAAMQNVVAYQEHTRSLCAVDASVRIDVALLDTLSTRVRELASLCRQIAQPSGRGGSAFESRDRIARMSDELQRLLTEARRQPLTGIFARLPRVVRDLAVASAKQIRLEMQGETTQLDKSVLEAIKAPLTHLIRNAVDHGIELPDRRLACGKAAEGCIRVCASCEQNYFTLEITDDGGGIDLGRVRRKAMDMGLISPQDARNMSESQLASLIFQPGLSTAQAVTMLSGRGVGLDVVKTNIEQIGGAIELRTARCQGTTVRINIPLVQ